MSLPKEPRQKMINIMYLVLTALLALNVSSEILNAFKTIDQSLSNANGIIQKKNQDIYKSLASKLNDPKTAEKAAIWAPRANKAKVMLKDGKVFIFCFQSKTNIGIEIEVQIKNIEDKNRDCSVLILMLAKGLKRKKVK